MKKYVPIKDVQKGDKLQKHENREVDHCYYRRNFITGKVKLIIEFSDNTKAYPRDEEEIVEVERP